VGFVLPGDEDVSHAAAHEGVGGAAGAGVEDGDVGVERGNEGAGAVGVVVEGAQGVAPGGEIVPAGAAGGLGVGGDDLDVGAREVVPVVNGFGIAGANNEDDGGGVGSGVVGEARLPVGR